MNEIAADTGQPSSGDKVLAALRELGHATAAAIAERAGIGYSTTTPKLRALEKAGHAKKAITGDRRTLWRLTEAGASIATDAAAHKAAPARDNPDSDAAVQPQERDAPASTPGRQRRASPDGPTRPVDGGGTIDAADHAEAAEPATPPTTTDAPPARDGAATGDRATAGRRAPANPKRPKGTLRDAVLKLLQDHPDSTYKVSEVCKLLDQANQHAGVNKASAGAVANALDRLTFEGSVTRVTDKPATFQAQ